MGVQIFYTSESRFPKHTHRFYVSHFTCVHFWKSPHSYIITGMYPMHPDQKVRSTKLSSVQRIPLSRNCPVSRDGRRNVASRSARVAWLIPTLEFWVGLDTSMYPDVLTSTLSPEMFRCFCFLTFAFFSTWAFSCCLAAAAARSFAMKSAAACSAIDSSAELTDAPVPVCVGFWVTFSPFVSVLSAPSASSLAHFELVSPVTSLTVFSAPAATLLDRERSTF